VGGGATGTLPVPTGEKVEEGERRKGMRQGGGRQKAPTNRTFSVLLIWWINPLSKRRGKKADQTVRKGGRGSIKNNG